MSARSRRFPLLDSMRAFAFGGVFFAHAAFFAGFAPDGSTLRPFLARLDVGLRIFFLISGFLLYRPFVQARLRGHELPSVGAYAWRRVLRIVPAYWLALVATALWLGGAESDVLTPEHAPLYFGFAHIYDMDTISVTVMPHAWSLCVEMSFYLLLPLYALLLRRFRGGLRTELVAAAVLFAVGLAYKLWVFTMGPVQDTTLLRWHLALPEYIDTFAIGMAVAAVSAAYEGSTSRPARAMFVVRRPWIAWLTAAALFVLASKGIGLDGGVEVDISETTFLARHYLYAAIALCLVLPAIAGDPGEGRIRRLLAWRPLLWVGAVSYGAYLYHFAVLQQLERWDFGSVADDVSPYLWFPVALALILAIAAVSWYAYERPLLRLKRLVPATRGRVERPVHDDVGGAAERGR